MTEDKDLNEKDDSLMKAIGKSEILNEEHHEEMQDFEDETEEIEGWLTVVLKALKSVFL